MYEPIAKIKRVIVTEDSYFLLYKIMQFIASKLYLNGI